MKISDLTRGERLVLERRRAGESQKAAAKRHGVTLYQYGGWEREEFADAVPPSPNLGHVREHEVYFIRRRRRGIDVNTLARRIGVTRWWLTQMESGRAPIDRLADYWREKVSKVS